MLFFLAELGEYAVSMLALLKDLKMLEIDWLLWVSKD